MVKVPRAERRFFAGARGFGISVRRPRPGRPYPVSRLLRTGREVCGFGRTVYPPEIFRYLGSRYADPGTGEVDLWRTFQALPSRIQHRAVLLDGQPCDTGTFAGYYHYLPRFVRGWAAPSRWSRTNVSTSSSSPTPETPRTRLTHPRPR